MPNPIAVWNPARDVWETSQTGQMGLFCEHSDVFSETWPASGTMRRGVVYAPQTLEPRIIGGESLSWRGLPTPTVDDSENATRASGEFQSLTRAMALLPTPVTSEVDAKTTRAEWEAKTWKTTGGGSTCSDSPTVGSVEVHGDEDNTHEGGTRWGDYAPAILRWEGLTRPAPPPLTPDGKTGKPRLSPAFVEWMMGLPDGWVTDCPVTRNQAIRALGNGVVPQQAAQALRQLLDMKGDNRGGD